MRTLGRVGVDAVAARICFFAQKNGKMAPPNKSQMLVGEEESPKFHGGFQLYGKCNINHIHYTILGLDFGIMYRFAGNRSQIYIVSYINIMQVG